MLRWEPSALGQRSDPCCLWSWELALGGTKVGELLSEVLAVT